MPGNNLISGSEEGRQVPGERCGTRELRIQRICLERRGACFPGRRFRRGKQRCAHSLFAPSRTHIKAGDRPDRNGVNPGQLSNPVDPRKRIPLSQLAPANGHFFGHGKKPGRRTAIHNAPKSLLILFRRPLAIRRTDSPVHAPASAARSTPAEKIFKSWPQVRRKRQDDQARVALLHSHQPVRSGSRDFRMACIHRALRAPG